MLQKSWGGKRTGSGRPAGTGRFGTPTKPIRIPEDRVSEVLKFLEGEHRYSLPLYGSKIIAGFPSPGDEYVERYLDLNAHLIKNPETTFYARVSGDSMINAGIFNNDLLVVDRSQKPIHGKVVVAVINGEMTVKRLQKSKDGYYLVAENPNYPPIKIRDWDEVRIWGVVISVIKKV